MCNYIVNWHVSLYHCNTDYSCKNLGLHLMIITVRSNNKYRTENASTISVSFNPMCFASLLGSTTLLPGLSFPHTACAPTNIANINTNPIFQLKFPAYRTERFLSAVRTRVREQFSTAILRASVPFIYRYIDLDFKRDVDTILIQ